jgi:hypothetical protein
MKYGKPDVILTVAPDGTTVDRPGASTTEVIHPTEIFVVLPTGEKISLDMILEHLQQEFGPWPFQV